jgi:Family of unknown function (DUF5686)/CarboxypepD_reg-like domain
MSKIRYLITAIIIFLPCYLFAGNLKGKVTDEKGARLPYATIYLEGTTIGVNANGNGDFELPVAPGLYKVVCQYVGYKQNTFNVSITGNETIEHNFILKDQSLEIKEVYIHANTEDPAYAIIRSAIKRRKFHLDQVRSFQTSIYLKGVMRSRKMPDKFMGQKVKDETDAVDSAGRGVLFLTEENADYYTDGEKEKTIIHSVHESGNESGLGFAQFPPVITFYENNVNIFGKSNRGFISPISENALFYYRYKLLGQFDEQRHTIYKIQVTQKRNYEPCFNGTIYISDEEWAIHSLNMTLVKESGMDMMDTLKVEQLFLPLHKDTWVVKSQVLYFTVNLFGFDITASGVTVYNNQKVNEPIPDSVFAGKITSTYDKTANKKDSSYWKVARPIPLEKDEKNNFVVKDSLNKRFNDPAHIDSIRRKGNKFKPIGLLTSGYSFSSKKYRNTYSTNSVLMGLTTENILNFNIVEGFNVAPKLSWRHFVDTGKTLYGDLAVRYGFSNTHFNAIARLYYVTRDRSFTNRSWTYGLEGGKYVFQYNPENPVLQWYNTYSDLFYRENDLKIYERWDATAYLGRNYGTGLSWYIRTAYQQRLPLQNTTTYSFIKGETGGYKNNAPPYLVSAATAWEKNDAAVILASVSYKPGYTFIQYPDRKVANSNSSWPRFTIWYSKGIPGVINSVSDFDKWKFSVQDEVRLRLFGNLQYNLVVGGFLNSNYVSIPDLMHLYGNRGIGLASPYLNSFQFAPYYDFSNKERLYGEAHIEYHLKGLLSNKIPLLRQARWYLLFGGNVFYATGTNYYTEAFIGIDNIGYKLARILRIDFVQSWDSHMGQNSGIRFGLNLNGNATVIKNNPLHSEW